MITLFCNLNISFYLDNGQIKISRKTLKATGVGAVIPETVAYFLS